MASLQQDPSGNYHVSFRFGGKRFKRSLKTRIQRKAEAAASHVEENIRLVETGRMTIPEGADVPVFLLSDGNVTEKPKLTRTITVGKLYSEYESSIPDGSLEPSSLRIAALHMRHFAKVLGVNKNIASVTKSDLQTYVTTRSKAKGLRGGKLSPATIKKELASFRTLWNWAKTEEFVSVPFPNKGLVFPKETEKPPFQTWAQIERQIEQGSLTKSEEARLWDCLYLGKKEIAELLSHIERESRYPFLYPMALIAAHTGARRSELCRLRLNDIDMAEMTITIHERKRSRSTKTTRVVPMTSQVHDVLQSWLEKKEDGSALFPEDHRVCRIRNDQQDFPGVSPKEASHHLDLTMLGSKWVKLKGWHVLRHSFISNCASSGVDQRFIDSWVGHQTDEQRRRYRHLFPDSQRKAINRVFTDNLGAISLQ